MLIFFNLKAGASLVVPFQFSLVVDVDLLNFFVFILYSKHALRSY